MKTLLRSTYKVNASDDQELMLRNAHALRGAGIGFDVPEDEAVWNYIKDFLDQHHHVPEASTIRTHFTRVREVEVVDRLDAMSVVTPRMRGDFLKLLEAQVENRRIRIVSEVLQEAAQIVDHGITIKEGRKERILRGPGDAVRYVLDRGHEVITPITGVRLSGDVTADGASALSEYERVEADPLAGIGQFTGVQQMDIGIKGAKRGELWLHAAFTGGMKSTLALNWAYNQAVYYRHSSVFFSLEMPYHQVRKILYAIHSAHEKFDDVRKKLGIGMSLDYSRIRDGELDRLSDAEVAALSPENREALIDGRLNPERPEKQFYFEHVIPDFNDSANNYGSIHVEQADPDKTDFTIVDLRSKAELLHSKDPSIAAVFIDHAGLMSSRNRHTSTTERLNEVLRDLKRISMSFNKGAGIAIIALFQLSREGFKAAEKNGGRYNLTHLSYANEAERSSDVVTAAWTDDDLRERNLVKFMCLKARDHKPFEEFYSGVLWPCRRIFTQHDVTVEAAKRAGDELDLLAED
jgi:hypothetical protein